MTLAGEARSLDVVTDPEPVSDSTVSSESPFFTANFRFRFRPFNTGAERTHKIHAPYDLLTLLNCSDWRISY